MNISPTNLAEAVLVFEQNDSVKEMLYSEFEAILDGFVPVQELADTKAKAVYLRIDNQLNVVAAVFFLLGFDSAGYADSRWNLPLGQLIESAATGPNMGSGPIRLSCYSQCGIEWHREGLWDPDMSPGHNDFSRIRKLIKSNRLSLSIDSTAAVGVPKSPQNTELSDSSLNLEHERELRNRIAQQLKEQRLRAKTLINEHQKLQEELLRSHNQRIQVMQDEFNILQSHFEQQQQLNGQLKSKLSEQADKISALLRQQEIDLKNAKTTGSQHLDDLRRSYQIETEAKVEAATTDLKQQLQIREIEMMYHREQEAALHEELAQLRQDKLDLLANSGDQMLEKLRKEGVTFVIYQPGMGHTTLSFQDVPTFLENPQAYMAAERGVSSGQYRSWLEHFEQPTCKALQSNGDVCGVPVTRIESPAEFHLGESDRCTEHQSNPLKATLSR